MGLKLKKTFLALVTLTTLFSSLNGLEKSSAKEADAVSGSIFYEGKSISKTDDYVNDLARSTSERDVETSLTFLLPGIGEDSSIWTNGDVTQIINEISYDSSSIAQSISSLSGRYDAGHLILTRPSYINNRFNLELIEYDAVNKNGNFSYTTSYIKEIKNFREHQIFMFETPKDENGYRGTEPLDDQFVLFERTVNSISYDFFTLFGFYPKVNLIGHTTGGLTAQMYANEYPNNVESLVTVSTPYKGSIFGDILLDLENGYNFTLDKTDLVNTPAFFDLQNTTKQENLKSKWQNSAATNNINAMSVSSCISVPFAVEILKSVKKNLSSYNNLRFNLTIDAMIALLDAASGVLSYDRGDYGYNYLINYDTFKAYREEVYKNAFDFLLEITLKKHLRLVAEAFKSELEILEDTAILVLDQILKNAFGKYYSIPKFILVLFLDGAYDEVAKKLCGCFYSLNGRETCFTCDGLFDVNSNMNDYKNFYRYVIVLDEKCLDHVYYNS